MKPGTGPAAVNEYVAGFPKEVRNILQKIRTTIRKAAPGAVETIKYRIPTWVVPQGNLVSVAAWRSYISFYPAPNTHADFKQALSPYAAGKATARFPIDEPIPYGLITRMVKLRVRKLGARG